MMTVGDTIKKNDRGHQIHAYQTNQIVDFVLYDPYGCMAL
jgi:hypothetical protein